MKHFAQWVLWILFSLAVLASCEFENVRPAPTVSYFTSEPILTQVKYLPTAIPRNQSITFKGLRLTMKQAEITAGYDTEYGFKREPTLGGKFLWVDIQLENISNADQRLPTPEHFSAVYGTNEEKPSYGHRQDRPDYSSLKPVLYQGQKEEAWLRFDIPESIELNSLNFVFLPDSLHVNLPNPESGYSWADHPQYFWQCQ
jgi:hypothetical protein